jgi:hypothetical protein
MSGRNVRISQHNFKTAMEDIDIVPWVYPDLDHFTPSTIVQVKRRIGRLNTLVRIRLGMDYNRKKDCN